MSNGATLAGLHLIAAEPEARVLQARLQTLLDDQPNAVRVIALAGLLVESFRSAPPPLKQALAEGVSRMLDATSDAA
jgi:hypothetical protein